MKENYHTHTSRCLHADGTDREYVEAAIAEGFKTLGFSDHCPTLYNELYTSYYKMTPEQLPEYCRALTSLREEFSDKIDIKIGLEAEFFPDIWELSFGLWAKYPIEYLIIGQHYIDHEVKDGINGDHSHSSRSFGSPRYESRDRLRRYVDRVIEGISTDAFTYIAHPDLVSFTGDIDAYREEMYRLIRAAEKYGTPLEYNLLGKREGRGYPRREFWELVSEFRGSAILGTDAHSPAELRDRETVSLAKAELSALGVKILDTVELRNPFKK